MKNHPRQGRVGGRRKRLLGLLCAGLMGGSVGCVPTGFVSSSAPAPPAESLVLRGEAFVEEKPPVAGTVEAKMAGAHELFRRGEYGKAADLFNSLKDKKNKSQAVVDEATFHEAECYRLQARYPRAADLYSALLKQSPNCAYKEQATMQLWGIVNYWLEDTRVRMKKSKSAIAIDNGFVHFDKTKPLLDEEGRAIEKCELVHYNDIDGRLGVGDKAQFYAGVVMFHKENYGEADHYLSQVHENYPNSPHAPDAIRLAIISKTFAAGGADYDGRKVAEARALVQTAVRNYPQLANDTDDLNRKLIGIEMAQAEKDYKLAEFYRRTGHPGSSWFCHRLVQRRYPNTKFAQMSGQRLSEMEAKLRKEGKPVPSETQTEAPAPAVKEEPVRRAPADAGPPPGPLPPQMEPSKPGR